MLKGFRRIVADISLTAVTEFWMQDSFYWPRGLCIQLTCTMTSLFGISCIIHEQWIHFILYWTPQFQTTSILICKLLYERLLNASRVITVFFIKKKIQEYVKNYNNIVNDNYKIWDLKICLAWKVPHTIRYRGELNRQFVYYS